MPEGPSSCKSLARLSFRNVRLKTQVEDKETGELQPAGSRFTMPISAAQTDTVTHQDTEQPPDSMDMHTLNPYACAGMGFGRIAR